MKFYYLSKFKSNARSFLRKITAQPENMELPPIGERAEQMLMNLDAAGLGVGQNRKISRLSCGSVETQS